jgi:hypothetical protein
MSLHTPPLAVAGNTVSALAQNGTRFIADTVQLARTDPTAAAGRCLGAGLATAAGGLATAAVGALSETLGTTAMVLGGCAMFLTRDTGLGGRLFLCGAGASLTGKALQVGGAVAMVAGGASAVVGTGLLAVGMSRRPALPSGPPAAQASGNPQGNIGPSSAKRPLRDRVRITVIDV